MQSYELFQSGTRGWFFSPNRGLTGAKERPSKIESWKAFKALLNVGDKKAKVIADLAGIPDNSLSERHWPTLKRAYDGWPADRYAIFQSSGTGGDYLCNVFVGDVIYLAGKSRMRDGGKYYGAKEFYTGGVVPRCEQIEQRQSARGDIASWDFGNAKHMEIVTKVTREKGIFWDTNEFCSRGAGRAGGEQGLEKCGGGDRALDASNIKFFRLR
ncbi:hypothetical protein [Archangium primigenium]|uniref:hypothetical protein n=1 Tax=[Archangium] primigenium TaxID=2792470 RepID=UPI001957A9F6|nr:hypothetical protein [Archangium primigenium]